MRSQRVGHDWTTFTCLEWRSSSLEWRASCPNIFTKNMLCVRHCSRHCAKSFQLCLTICNPMDCSLPGCSVHGILQARILEWVAMPSSRGSSRPRDWTHISCGSYTGGGFFLKTEPPEKPILDPRTQQKVLNNNKKISILLGRCILTVGAEGRT